MRTSLYYVSMPRAPDMIVRNKKCKCMYGMALLAFQENFLKISWKQVSKAGSLGVHSYSYYIWVISGH